MAAYDTFRRYGQDATRTADEQAKRYALLGQFYEGTWTADPRWPQVASVYTAARQVVKSTKSIVDTYEQLVWAGTLPLPDRDLPEGARNAIPFLPRTGSEATDENLLRAFYTLFDIWRWRGRMAQIPKTTAIYGDCLVELAEDRWRANTTPNLVNPWQVPVDGIELDYDDNVKAYVIEKDVVIPESTAWGRTVAAETYRYRKEVDTDAFRYFKDDKPWRDPDGHGEAVQPNPYGFAPACWFRHELVNDDERGRGAFESTLVQAMEINSLLSSAIDYMRKQFGMPIGVVGSAMRAGKTYTLPGGATLSFPTTERELAEAQRGAAENVPIIPLSEDGKFITAQFDIGQTREVLTFLVDNLISENPVAKYAQLLGELKQATGPGVRMTLAPIVAEVQSVQANHDPQMVKLVQMATAIYGFRLKSGYYPSDVVAARRDRFQAFAPYDLTSYGKGLLDATIDDRDPFPPSKLEDAQWLAIAADLPPWALRRLGIDEEDIADQDAANREAQAAQIAAFSVAAAGSQGVAPNDAVANGQEASNGEG